MWYHSPVGGPHELEPQIDLGRTTDVCVHGVSVGVKCDECQAKWEAVKEDEEPEPGTV